MSQIPPDGWYRDPTNIHSYRYWGGGEWTNQVSDGGTSGTDPNPLAASVASTPPAPGTAAEGPTPTPTTAQDTGSGGGFSFGTFVGVLLVIVAVIVLVVVLFAAGGDDLTSTTVVPAPTEAPATTTGS